MARGADVDVDQHDDMLLPGLRYDMALRKGTLSGLVHITLVHAALTVYGIAPGYLTMGHLYDSHALLGVHP